MSIPTKPLEVTDFTGGITDYYIDGPVNRGQVMDNFVFNPNRKPVTRWGSTVFEDSQIPMGSFRIHHITSYDDTLLAFAHKKVYYIDTGAWTELQGPSAGTLFTLGDANSLVSSTDWRDHIILANDAYSPVQKIYEDDAGDLQLRNAGLPYIKTTGLSITPPPTTGAGASYLYAFVLRYDYTVKTVNFLDRGPVYYYPTAITDGTIGPGNAASITLPTTLITTDNWDADNIDIEIYRTQDAGDVYYYVATVPLNGVGSGSYSDANTDATIGANETLYTTDGSALNEQPPNCKLVHVVNDIGYYGDIKDGTEEKTTLLRQSIPGDVDSVPSTFYHDFEQPLKGLSSIFDRPMAFCEEHIYRIDGIITATGGGDLAPRRIDDKAGCVSQRSIVQTHLGIFWAGAEGFYWSDGFKVKKISNHLNVTYKTFVENATRSKRIVGTYDKSNERVYWALCKENTDADDELDTWFILDLKFQNNPAEATFTSASSGTYFKCSALYYKDHIIYRGDARGYVLQHQEGTYTDPKIDIGVTPANWEELVIIHTYKSCFIDFGSKFYRKWVPRILVSAANITNLSLAISSSNDNNRVMGDLKPIRSRNNITWGDSLPIWGDPEARWNFQGIIEEWRRFPKKGLRCNYKQISFTNAYVQIVNSDLLGKITLDTVAKTATLGGTFNWPSDVVDYYLSFESDGYEEQFLITARTPTTLTFSDSGNLAPPTGQYNFIMKGYPKGEVLELNGYVFNWEFISKTHAPFNAASLGTTPNG